MQIESRVRWLKVAAGVTMGFGILIAAAAIPTLAAPTAFLLDLIYFPVDGVQTMGDPASRLFSAITGGVLTGWGLMAWLIATELLRERPELARRIIITSIGTWFLIDSSMSIAAGAPLNAGLNVSFLALFCLPVLGLRSNSTRAEAAS